MNLTMIKDETFSSKIFLDIFYVYILSKPPLFENPYFKKKITLRFQY